MSNSKTIDPDAIKVVKRLRDAGFDAYLVGGCVRDWLLDRQPKDYDIATSATPSQIKRVFPSCRIIGRRFRLAHVRIGGKIMETATFRANPRKENVDTSELLIKHDNVFGTEQEDAKRRDFTINGLFWDISSKTVIDHVDGTSDIEAKLIRTIGDPSVRFKEDPVRMLRAIKFAARLDFSLEADTESALRDNRAEIRKSSTARVHEEVMRMLRSGFGKKSIELLLEYQLLSAISPSLASIMRKSPAEQQVVEILDDEEKLWHQTWNDSPVASELNLSFLTDEKIASRKLQLDKVLNEMDLVAATHSALLTNSAILSALFLPFLTDVFNQPNSRTSVVSAAISELVAPIANEMKLPRREVERTKQILSVQKKLQRGSGIAALAGRDYYQEAALVHHIFVTSTDGTPQIDISSLDSTTTNEQKQRKRRRGGRRRRRSAV